MKATYDPEVLDKMERWHDDPRLFVRECLGAEPDIWQDSVLAVLPWKTRVALIACKGPGKSTLLAWIILWWIATRISAQVICTSINKDNLRDGLWKELSAWFRRSHFLQAMFHFRKERIEHVDPDEAPSWWVSARGWAKDSDPTSQASALAGFHGPACLYVGDEAGDYPPGIMPAADAVLANVTPETGNEAKIIVAGNPTNPAGPLGEISTNQAHLWHVVNITGDPDAPDRAQRVSEKWAREQISLFGRNNPWVLVNVFGRFPPVGFNQLIGPDDVRAAMARNPDPKDYQFVQKRIGVDVALYGDDESIIFPRQGCVAYQYAKLRNASNFSVAARVVAMDMTWKAERICVDSTGGYGAGVIEQLQIGGRRAVGVCYSESAASPQFYDLRTEIWWRMVEHIKSNLALPDDVELLQELVAATYSAVDGKIKLSSKDDMKKVLGRSPDRADALANTYVFPDCPSREALGIDGRRGNIVTDVVRDED